MLSKSFSYTEYYILYSGTASAATDTLHHGTTTTTHVEISVNARVVHTKLFDN